MSIELPVRPASAAVEQATEVIESGIAKAGASLGTAIDRIGDLDKFRGIDLDEAAREAADRFRQQADERDQLALVASVAFVVLFVVAFVLVMRRRSAPVRKATPARKSTRTKGGSKA